MIGQGMSDNELVELLQNTLPQDLTAQQIEKLRQAIRSSPGVREALLEELALETGLASRLAPDHMGAEEFVEKICNLSAERSRTKWIWLSMMFLLVGGLVIGGVGLAWHFATKPDGPELVIDDTNKDANKDALLKDALLKDGKPLDDDKKLKPLTTGESDKTKIDDGKTKTPPVKVEENAKPMAQLPMPPYSPPWRLYDDAMARGDRRWASRVEEVVRPIGASRMQLNEREGDVYLGGKFELLPPNDDGRVVRLRFSDTRKMKLSFWNEQQGVRVEFGDDRTLRSFAMTRSAPVKGNPHGLPEGTDDRFYRKNVVSRIDQVIDFNWDNSAPNKGVDADNFAVRWEGIIKIAKAGKYRFIATSDDGVIVTIAGKRIISDWVSRAATASVGEIELPQGEHDILVEYYDDSSQASMKLEWEGPDISRQVVPSSVLRTARQDGRQPGLKARYFSGPEADSIGVEKLVLLTDDDQRWRMLRENGLDLRYQDGQLLITRGDIVLLAAPMSKPPQEVTMEVEGRFWLAEELRFRPIDLAKAGEAARVAPIAKGPGIEIRKASDLSWRLTQAERDKVVSVTNHEDGSVSFSRIDPQTTHDFRFETPIEMLSGVEVTLEVAAITPGMMLAFQSPIDRSTLTIAVGTHRGDRVLCYNGDDRNDIERRHREGLIVGDRFWVRNRFSVDSTQLEVSVDGVHFAPFDYREVDMNRSPEREAVVAVFGRHDKGERSITLGTATVRRRSALEQLADPALVANVGSITDERLKKPYSTRMLITEMAAGKPEAVSDASWELACSAVLFQTPIRGSLRQDIPFDMIRLAIAANVPTDKIMNALVEVPHVIALSREDHKSNSHKRYLQVFDALAQRIWSSGDRDQLLTLLNRYYLINDFGWVMRWHSPKQTAPPVATRLAMFHLWDRARFGELRDVALRHEFTSRLASPWIDRTSDDYSTRLLGAWMLAQASAQLADMPTEDETDRQSDRYLPRSFPPHPLIVESDRESMNTVSEFLAAVDSKAFDHACRILTRQSLPDGIAPVDPNGRLFKATYVLLREMIEQHEPLATKLQQQYAAIGMIRLRQSIDQGRLDNLEALATQFHGTQASRQALSHLADRDLSMGDFFSAAARYDTLLEQATDEARPTITAKRRLALAMAGEDTGFPVTQPVKMGSQTMSPGDFEQLVSSLLDERRKSGFMPDHLRAEEQQAFGPKPVKLTTVMDMSLPRDMSERTSSRIREVSYAHKDNIVLMHQHGRLTAFDLVSRRVLWRKDESSRDLSSFASEPATPMVYGQRVYVPFFRDKRTELTCFDLLKGDVIWRQTFDDAIVGDTVAVGPWLYTLSVRREVGNYGDLILRRLAPETGESVMAKRVLRVRYGEELFRVGRPQLVGDALVFRSGASLVSCDLLGSPRWIRRLSLVSPSVDSQLFDAMAMSEIVVDGDRMIVASPGSPYVVCISARTGEEQWSYLQPRLRKVIGKRGEQVVLATSDTLESLDLKTGKLIWHSPLAADPDAVLPAGKDMLVTVALEQFESEKKEGFATGRLVTWLSAVDGKVVSSQSIEEQYREVFDVESLFTDGKVLLGVCNLSGKSKANGKLVIIEGK